MFHFIFRNYPFLQHLLYSLTWPESYHMYYEWRTSVHASHASHVMRSSTETGVIVVYCLKYGWCSRQRESGQVFYGCHPRTASLIQCLTRQICHGTKTNHCIKNTRPQRVNFGARCLTMKVGCSGRFAIITHR